MKYQVHTFGCKVNTYDTGLIQKNLKDHGFMHEPSSGGIHVLNTCAVTAEATKEAVKSIRRIKAKDPLATIVVTGCAAQVDTDSFTALPGVDLVVANSHKGLLPFLIEQHFKGVSTEKVFKSNIFRKEDLEAGGGVEDKHTRAFVKIQDGCNSFCTFCIIPYARGKSRSLGMLDLAKRVNELYVQGFREVVLTGVHIGDYEDMHLGKARGLEDLVEHLLKTTKMPRFRLTSLEPIELTDRLIELYKDERLCAHFHMSIQSAETATLAQMKRKYTQNQVIEALSKIQQNIKNAYVGMDVIAGFPTESDSQFEETYRVLSQTPWTRLHVFPYSERQGTKAAAMEVSVPSSERKDRARKLRDLSLHRFQAEALKQVGTQKKILLLKGAKNEGQGVSRDFWNVRLNESSALLTAGEQNEIAVQVTSVLTSAQGSGLGDTQLLATYAGTAQ